MIRLSANRLVAEAKTINNEGGIIVCLNDRHKVQGVACMLKVTVSKKIHVQVIHIFYSLLSHMYYKTVPLCSETFHDLDLAIISITTD